MRFLQTTILAVVLALAGVSVAAAQEPEQDKDKQKQQEEQKKKQPPPKAQSKSEDPKAQPRTDKEKEKQDIDKQKQQRNQQQQQEKAWRQSASQSNANANSQRGDRNNVRRIPQEKFQVSFGRQHHFHVQRRDDRRFQYGGYVFEYVDAWPAEWSWHDDCYIEEDGDDYFLVDLVHPEARILVVIVG
jgi:hypothetical protein